MFVSVRMITLTVHCTTRPSRMVTASLLGSRSIVRTVPTGMPYSSTGSPGRR